MCILIDPKNKALIDSKTQTKVFPACFDDLVQYHAYLLTGKHPKMAQQCLKDVFKGERVITGIVEGVKQWKR